MKKFFVLLFSIAPVYLFGQSPISGHILGLQGEPLKGAHIANVSSGTHAHSLDDGSYKIDETVIGDSILVEYIGHKTETFVLADTTNNTVYLQAEPILLETLQLSRSVDGLQMMKNIDLQIAPVSNSQEMLTQVPGLFIGQHAGGGKAEQIFLRGFDIDHGTDLAISVDGMPVNMVSHSHGQGYADLHFVIPELIQKVEFGKGPHEASVGNFGTAGYINFKTKDKLKGNSLSVENGSFNTKRIAGLFNIMPQESSANAYIAVTHKTSDGPFESSQLFSRTNAFGKYVNRFDGKKKLTISGSYFTSRWDASGQIPVRAVDQGLIGRFGAIDDTEGGETSRSNLQLELYVQISKNTNIQTSLYYTNYSFQLFSNFTFYLEDSTNGDQIMQQEIREMFGLTTAINNKRKIGRTTVRTTVGLSLRQDNSIGNELSKTINRKTTLYSFQKGDVHETNYAGFAQMSFVRGIFRIEPGVRYDIFQFQYIDDLSQQFNTMHATEAVVSPKIKASATFDNVQVFAKSSRGFHSNDTRVVLFKEAGNPLPKAWGNDLGIVYQKKRLVANAGIWHLDLDQEFVYVGDAGIVEPSGATRRYGVDLGLRYQVNRFVFISADGTHTVAKSVEDEKGNNFIPLAPINAGTFGIGVKDFKNWNLGIRGRYLGDRAANESFSVTAEGYTIVDANASYVLGKVEFKLTIFNMFNVEWNETQFLTESRLQNEVDSVEEIHFTPGAPISVQVGVKYNF